MMIYYILYYNILCYITLLYITLYSENLVIKMFGGIKFSENKFGDGKLW